MKWIFRVMSFFGYQPPHWADDTINEDNHTAFAEHREMMETVRAQSTERIERNSRLKAALAEAKEAVGIPALGDLERALQNERPARVRDDN